MIISVENRLTVVTIAILTFWAKTSKKIRYLLTSKFRIKIWTQMIISMMVSEELILF